MDSMLFQYILIAVIVLFAGYYLFKMLAKTFGAKKFKKQDSDCDSDCGCS